MARVQFQTLTEPMYYILLSLTEERYGYEIMQTITDRTKSRVVVGPGTLYTLLGRFQKEGIIEQVSDDGRRKTYVLTKSGRELLLEEHTRLKMLVEDGEKVLSREGF
ncbi:helix-turn-helix transcriptional regulator [Tissierella sp. Yu-01]|uniref:PadR family transcriptional regulator n=1 Tax=Tissierella sp. Yu-01 TaxID=3035694 RepID=UPI00240DF24A|nr:helix-turn-helix transcriptional regulator [Tissierella sp. Yu-01]WFA08242.1 helix-turn-helix transcriptional regulator [Tissierella sp. Yu-01]